MTSFKRQFVFLLLSACLLCVGLNSYANENIDVQISGFGSLFATHAGEDGMGYYREFTTEPQDKSWSLLTDSNLGVQIDAQFDSNLSAVVQFVTKDYLENNLNETLRWANIKYSGPSIDVRLGRTALDVHMLSEYRDVGFAYLWVRPITEFYTPILFSYVDGADISYFHELDSGTIQFKLYSGISDGVSLQSTDVVSVGSASLYGTSIMFESQNWKLRGAAVRGKITEVKSTVIKDTLQNLNGIKTLYPALWPNVSEIIDRVDPNDSNVEYYSLGMAYNSENIQIQSEISLVTLDGWEIVPSTYSAYISIAKPINDFTPYIVGSMIKIKDEPYSLPTPSAYAPANIQGFHQLLQTEFDMGLSDQQTITLGVRWDIKDNLSLKAQWDHSKIKNNRSALWHNKAYLISPSNVPDTMDTFSIGFNFIF